MIKSKVLARRYWIKEIHMKVSLIKGNLMVKVHWKLLMGYIQVNGSRE